MNQTLSGQSQQPITGQTRIGRFLRFLRDDCPENPRVVVLWVSSFALIMSLAATTRACSKWILYHGDLGSGACWVFGVSIAGLMTLAGFAVGWPKAWLPGNTKTTSDTIITQDQVHESTSTLVTDPVPAIVSPSNGCAPGSPVAVVGRADTSGEATS